MRKNVQYAEITCDICGKKEHIQQGSILPIGWGNVEIRYEEWDACNECIEMVTNYIKRLKEQNNDT